jgi:hypothetical protein
MFIMLTAKSFDHLQRIPVAYGFYIPDQVIEFLLCQILDGDETGRSNGGTMFKGFILYVLFWGSTNSCQFSNRIGKHQVFRSVMAPGLAIDAMNMPEIESFGRSDKNRTKRKKAKRRIGKEQKDDAKETMKEEKENVKKAADKR